MSRKKTCRVVLVLLAILLVGFAAPVSADDKTPVAQATSGAVVVRVDSGGAGFSDAVSGMTWEADHPYAPAGTDGATLGWGYLGPRWMQVIGASRPVAGTTASKVYQTQRQDATGYRFDVPNGQYRVTLRLAELYVTARAGMNVYDVFCQGQRALGAVDVAGNAGLYRAYDLMFSAKVTEGVLNIAFVPKSGAIAIAGIDVESESTVAAAQTPGLTKTAVVPPPSVVTTTVVVTATSVVTATQSPVGTKLPTQAATPAPTTPQPAATPMPSATSTATSTTTSTATGTPSFTATITPSFTATPVPSQTSSATVTAVPSKTAAAAPSLTPTAKPSPSATAAPATATAMPSPATLPTPTAASTPQTPQSEVGRLTRDNFSVTFHEVDRQGALAVLDAMLVIKTRLAEETGLSVGTVNVQLFSSREEYNQALGATAPADQVGNIVDNEHIWMLAPSSDNQAERADILKGVEVEITRLALNSVPNMPGWLRDGLASYEARLWNDARQQYMRSLVLMRRIASLRGLEGQTYNYLGGAITAHTVVEYMVKTYGIGVLPKLLTALQDRPFDLALRDSAGVAFADFDRAWVAYVTMTYK